MDNISLIPTPFAIQAEFVELKKSMAKLDERLAKLAKPNEFNKLDKPSEKKLAKQNLWKNY